MAWTDAARAASAAVRRAHAKGVSAHRPTTKEYYQAKAMVHRQRGLLTKGKYQRNSIIKVYQRERMLGKKHGWGMKRAAIAAMWMHVRD